MSTRTLYKTLGLAAVSCFLAIACRNKSTQPPDSSTFVRATTAAGKFETNECILFQMNNFWIIEGYSYKTTASDPLYPQVQMWLHNYTFDTGTYTIGIDSVAAYYNPTITDTIPAIGGTIKVAYKNPDICGGIEGTFYLTFRDGTVLSNGAYVTGPICYRL